MKNLFIVLLALSLGFIANGSNDIGGPQEEIPVQDFDVGLSADNFEIVYIENSTTGCELCVDVSQAAEFSFIYKIEDEDFLNISKREAALPHEVGWLSGFKVNNIEHAHQTLSLSTCGYHSIYGLSNHC